MPRDRDDDESDDAPRRGDHAAARRKVSLPAVFLMLFGFAGLAVGLVYLAVVLAAPLAFGEAFADSWKPVVMGRPPSKARNDELARIEVARRTRQDSPAHVAFVAFGVAVSALTAVGGLRMKGLNNWGLSLVASIATLYPCSCCCLLTAPFGLWSLIVLLNPDVKAAFAAGRGLPPRTDDD